MDSTTPVVNAYDEYGNLLPGTDPARYGWLGGKQRSTETPSGATLMGVRLYDPTTGRFLSVDPIAGGNANAYDYVNGDPLNRYDLDGKWGWFKKKWKRLKKSRFGRWVGKNHGAIIGVGFSVGCSFLTGGVATAACVIGGSALAGAASYHFSTPRRKRHIGGYWAATWRPVAWGVAGFYGGRVGFAWRRWRADRILPRWR